MFTGIVEELGTVRSVSKGAKSAVLKITASTVVSDVKQGDSICVNGVCLTVAGFTGAGFSADVMAETLRRSNLGELGAGDRVNLERALRLSDRLGGHIVSGHIDGVGSIRSIVNEDIANVFTVDAPADVMRYIINKGSIAIDGISLTVVDHTEDAFRVSIIPHTAAQTTLGFKKAGSKVNLEPDVIAKYVERLFPGGGGPGGQGKPGMTMGFLAEHGFM
ncbi:MAG TPA: riboflavin synthase [Nitrospirota bacterium]|jgi:riboflavin synthase